MIEVPCFLMILRRPHVDAELHSARQADVGLVDGGPRALDSACSVLRGNGTHPLDRCGDCLVLVHSLDILRMSIAVGFLLFRIGSQ